MHCLIFGLLTIFCINIKLCNSLSAQLTLYQRGAPDNPIILSGEVGVTFITELVDFSCACITGLWAFYENDNTAPLLVIGGEQDYCVPINDKIYMVTLLSAPSGESNANTISIFNREMSELSSKLIYKKFSPNTDAPTEITTDMNSVSIVTVGDMPYTFTGSSPLCLAPNKTGESPFYYCIFNNTVLSEKAENPTERIARVTPYCEKDAKMVTPAVCKSYFKGSGSCPAMEESVQKPGKNYFKRSTPGQQGRIMIAASTKMKNYTELNTTQVYHQDYVLGGNISHNTTSPLIKGELFNFLIQGSEKILGLRENRTQKYGLTAFRLLDLCKKISKASCPNYYAGDDFYDVMVGTFISLQSKVYKFQETFADFPTERRITEALNKCLNNFTVGGPYPFLRTDAINNTFNETDKLCEKVSTPGYFVKYDTYNTLEIFYNSTGFDFEPVIDTAWQAFIHAHSACYDYFPTYNDHHTFTSIIMSLFTNDIHDQWFRWPHALDDDETTVDIYGFAIGFLPDGVRYSSYCSAMGRLESKYPWDLKRPEKRI